VVAATTNREDKIMLHGLTSYEQALNSLGIETKWSCSFGNPGEGGYTEFRRDAMGRRYTISNGSYLDFAPFNWTATKA
jgi:hypothetical protein